MKRFIILVVFLYATAASNAAYYIDFQKGNDGNSGRDTSHAWKRQPYMQGWAGTTYTHAPGDSFIFKGGSVWDNTCFTITIAANGSISARDYYGVDSSWYTGGTFSRPIFDFNWKAPASSRCTAVYGSNAANLIFDCLEMKNILCTVNAGTGFFHFSDSKRVLIKNCYLHGWKLIQGIAKDDAHGGVYTVSHCTTTVVDNCEISNKEAMDDNVSNGVLIFGVDTVKYCKLHDSPTAMLGNLNAHHNEIYNIDYPNMDFDPTYHTNLWYGIYTGSFNHNYVHHIGQVGASLYPNPANGGSGSCGNGAQYLYNNVVILDSIAGASYLLDINYNFEGSGLCGIVYVCNNIFQTKRNDKALLRCIPAEIADTLAYLIFQNNLLICPSCNQGDSVSGWYNAPSKGNVKNVVNNHNLSIAPSYAESNGLNRTNLYKPLSQNCPTVGRGINLSAFSIFSSDYFNIRRPILDSASTQKWDVGAYQFVPLKKSSGIRNTPK